MATRRSRPSSTYGCAASLTAPLNLADCASDNAAILAFQAKSVNIWQYSATDSHSIVSSETMKGLPLLAYTSAFHLLQNAKWFEPIVASANIVLESNSTHTLLAAARAGVGVAVLPRFVAREHDDLVAVSDNVADNDVWLITHPEFRRDPKIRATADFLKRLAGGPDGIV